MPKIGWERCPFCYRQNIHTSTPKHLWEQVAFFVLLQPVRCHDCMRRFFRPLFALPSPKVLAGRVAAKEPAPKEPAAIDKGRAA
jgi:hypothetical protein